MGTLMDVPMPFYQLERILGGPPYNLQMKSRNFQHILSWQARNDPAVPTSYSVLYRHHGNSNWTTARQCSGTAQLSCDLTEDFKHRSSDYYVFVQSIEGPEVFNSSMLHFAPLSQTSLGPPEVNITPCLNCINVTIKLPPSHYREKGKLLSLIDIYEELDYVITLKSQGGQHKMPREKTTEEVFSTVIEELYPSRNYCVSVEVTASLNKNSIPSPWKCVPSDSMARPGYHVASVASAVCVLLVIAAALKCLHAGGYFLQSKSLPHALESIRRLVYLSWIFPSEEVDSVEVIPREVKAKAGGCGGSSSDSDSEDSDSSAPWDHNYTRREVLSRAPPVPGTSHVQYSENRPCEATQATDPAPPEPAGAEEHTDLAGDQDLAGDTDSGGELLSPFPELSCHYPARQSSTCFTINLQTVLLGSLEERGDSPAAALPAPQHEGHWQCAHALEAEADTGTVQKAPGADDCQEWQNFPSEEESDSSESDTDQGTGYMRRR
ncbi:interferon alpha/beta receptor 2 isoform X2 [Empidonax traillii]|uniref:interferon alpha/beta receptor 2 isoform X2 n=1 Tax=Empidonax traillii TaxID=164674 RepID=UPI000FFD1C71|nr:interferon alpha/beta receptor 2 isoform X2 [Empidonax traillii]XP_027764859.1 interferon alpha/beta receptor 2 isoform X2 [Empidonax traillii]